MKESTIFKKATRMHTTLNCANGWCRELLCASALSMHTLLLLPVEVVVKMFAERVLTASYALRWSYNNKEKEDKA